jgi:hypothetical protein
MEELLTERRLAGAGMPGQDDAPKVGEVDVLHRHRTDGPLCWAIVVGIGEATGNAGRGGCPEAVRPS